MSDAIEAHRHLVACCTLSAHNQDQDLIDYVNELTAYELRIVAAAAAASIVAHADWRIRTMELDQTIDGWLAEWALNLENRR